MGYETQRRREAETETDFSKKKVSMGGIKWILGFGVAIIALLGSIKSFYLIPYRMDSHEKSITIHDVKFDRQNDLNQTLKEGILEIKAELRYIRQEMQQP